MKVLDFGLAKRLDAEGEASVMTQEGAILGTPNYLSPELALGREVDSRSDIFSLGVVLYELAARQNPFAGASFGETLNNILSKSPEPLKPWNPNVTPDFERVVRKCLEKDPAKRYATPHELAADLRRLEAAQAGRDARNGKVVWMLVTAGVTACLLALIGWQSLRPGRSVDHRDKAATVAQTNRAPTALSRQRLVLMPFKSLASGEANEIFTEGLAVELFSRLSRIRGLRVIDGSGFVKAQGAEKDFAAKWRELNAGALLKGTVLKEQKQLRIRLQLLDSQSQELLRAFDFDREPESVLALQTEAAEVIAAALEVQLLADERLQLSRKPTENSQAYQVYLEGRAFWNRRTGKDITNAIARFNQAIAEDPAYALAHAGLADYYVILPEYANRPSGDAFPKAKAAALDALKYDSTLAEPRATLAYVKAYFDWDWSGAEAEFRRAIALNPRYATAHHWLALVLATMRRYDEALAEIRSAQEIDPLSPIINATHGSFLFFAGTPDLAVEVLKKQIAQDPSFVGAHNSLGLVYAYQGNWPETIAEFETIRRLDQNGAFGLDLLGMAYARAGRTSEARKVLSHLLELQRQGLELRINIATVLHGLGDDEGALKSLEEGLADHALGLDWMNSEPYLKDLRAHPHAQAILRKMHLVTEPVTTLIAPDPKSVAVLPFVNVSGDKADEPLSDGITDELIGTLQPVNGLQVKGRASSFYFKGRNERLQKIGQELQVNYLVEGTVSRAGNKLRIAVDLVTAADETQLWATSYDRPLDDLLAIRTDVATRVAESLKGKLLGEERQQLAKRGTENAEAYRLYLRGRYLASQGTDENLKQAMECFDRAISMDPAYALAYAALADCYYDLDYYTGQPVRQTFPKAQAAALKALELDGSLAKVRLVLAAIKCRLKWDWKGAEEEYRRAIALNPNSATAHDRLSGVLFSQRRFAEAAAEMKLAQELDPLSPGMNLGLAFCLSYDDKTELSLEILRRQIAQDPSSVHAHNALGWVYYDHGRWSEAVAAFEIVRNLKGSGVWERASLGCAYARVGRTNEAREILRQLQELPRQGLNYHVSVGAVQHALGDDEAALDSMEKALAEQASGLTALNWGVLWEELRPHPRAQAILRKMNLVK